MASSVQFENTYPEDERWLEAGAEAFALHFAACCYADRRNTDGIIPKSMVSRIALAVPPEAVQASVESLIETGFWTEENNAYRVVNYVEDKIGLPAEEKLANRARWAEDKRWRRRHNAGNHEGCPPDKCRQSGKLSQTDIGETPGKTPRRNPKRVQEDSSRTTRLVTTRLDSTPGGGSERESEARAANAASAGAPAAAAGGGDDGLDAHGNPRPEGMTPERWARYRAALESVAAMPEADPADTLEGLIPVDVR